MKTQTIITCPNCSKAHGATMPTDSCQYFWECPNCSSIIKPENGDCCVFCSFAEDKCPPMQSGIGCSC